MITEASPDRVPLARWEYAFLAAVVAVALALGFAHLGAPSIWHDEAIHLYATESILETGLPYLPSGYLYTSGLPYHYLLAPVVAVFGRGEAVIRAPSVVCNAACILLLFALTRAFFGRAVAVVAAILLVTSPWQLAWAREANFYVLHQALFLAFFGAAWQAMEAQSRSAAIRWGSATLGAYVLGGLTSLQTILFTGPVGAYGVLGALWRRSVQSRYALAAVLAVALALITLAVYVLALPQAEQDVIFKEGGIGGQTEAQAVDRDRSDPLYYPRFFANNLSAGYLLIALLGFGWMMARGGRKGLYWTLSFWLPIVALTLFLGYKQHRFMFYCYPLYVGACAYALVRLAAFLVSARQAWWRLAVAAVIVLFGLRLAVSTGKLLRAAWETASGSHITLAKHHPQWRGPALWVRDRMDGAAVITTAYLPVHYYTGRVDNWYPSRVMVWEILDSGMEGLRTTDELAAFMAEHPRGYFLADYRRFHQWPFFAADVAWVEENMREVEEASSAEVTVYTWGE